MAMGQNPGTLVNNKIDGKWMFIHPNMDKYGTIGFDPWPYGHHGCNMATWQHVGDGMALQLLKPRPLVELGLKAVDTGHGHHGESMEILGCPVDHFSRWWFLDVSFLINTITIHYWYRFCGILRAFGDN